MRNLNSKAKVVLVSLAAIALLCSAGVASAGTVGVAIVPPYDFDNSGTSDVMFEKNVNPNQGIIETQMVTGTTSTSRGWPDLNVGNSGGREYITVGAGVFEPGTAASIVTRKIGMNSGLIRIVKLEADGFTRATPGQFWVGGTTLLYDYIGAADMNDDGADDFVFQQRATDAVRIFFMDPATPFSKLQVTESFTLSGTHTPLGLGDADGDGLADVWTADSATGGVFVYLSDGTGNVSTIENPTAVPANYFVRGIGFFNRDDERADLLMEGDTGAADPGVLRIDYTGAGATSIDSTSFPALLDQTLGETTAQVGDYDGMNQLDIVTRLATPTNAANTGVLTVRIMNGDGTDLAGTSGTLPEIEDLDWDVITAITNDTP